MKNLTPFKFNDIFRFENINKVNASKKLSKKTKKIKNENIKVFN